jgi:Outer membrane protein beta-barrel domain
MKKKIMIFSFSLLFLSVSVIHAQKSSAIIKGGVNLANVSINDDGGIDDAKMLASFQVGIIGDFHLAPFLAIQPGLIVTGKGSKTESGTEGSSAVWSRATTNPLYLEMPVNLVFKTPTGPVKFFAGAGPYIAMGIGGKNKVRGAAGAFTYSSEDNIEWSNDDPTTADEEGAGFGIMRRFDYGLNGLVGIETGNIVISANYGLGLAKLQSGTDSNDDNNNKHRVLSFTLGFKL